MQIKKMRIAGAVIFFTVIWVGFALGWPEPKIIRQGGEIPVVESESPVTVKEAETINVEKETVVMEQKNIWQPPQFSGQNGALGWSENVFQVPPGMQARVDFWRDIYTKYTTDQGLLHDSQHVSLVYEAVDFRPIMANGDLSEGQKRKARKKLVDDKKKEIRERLGRLARSSSSEGLTGEDLRLWNLFSGIDEPDKFKLAMTRKRLRFQLGQSDRFLQGIYYSGRYLREMEKIFREKGLPIELTRLPFVESSFNVKARSRVGASGIWQFMRYTGRRFMRIHFAVDERNDPLRATEAAARLFRLNFEMLGQWPLAVTGYNHGPTGVQRVVRKFKTDNIVELVDERYGRFGFASANFYACFLAALEVEKNANTYFGSQIYWDAPLDVREIKLSQSLNKNVVLKWFNGDIEKAKEYNPHILRAFWAGYARVNPRDFVRIPASQYEAALADLKAAPSSRIASVKNAVTGATVLSKPAAASAAPVAESEGGEGIGYYLIGQGETLSEIAVQFGVSVSILKELNGIVNPRAIRAGQKLMVPNKN